MTDSPTATSAGRFEVRATADSHFDWIRTRLGVEPHDDVVAAHGDGPDRVRLRDRAVPRTLATGPRNPIRLSSERAAVFGAGADFMRHPGARHLTLAVLVDGSLPVERGVRSDRPHDQRGKAIASRCGRYSPDPDR